jgi:hypothetical protein
MKPQEENFLDDMLDQDPEEKEPGEQIFTILKEETESVESSSPPQKTPFGFHNPMVIADEADVRKSGMLFQNNFFQAEAISGKTSTRMITVRGK